MTFSGSIVIVNFNSGGHLASCLDSIARCAPAARVIVVDNASSDGSERVAPLRDGSSRDWLTIERNAQNLGFARAVNQGLSHADEELVLLLNPDCRLAPGVLERLCAEMEEHPECAIVAPQVHDEDGAIQGNARGDPDMLTGLFGRSTLMTRLFPRSRPARRNVQREVVAANGSSSEVDWVSGACMLARRDALRAVGGFDERYFLYWEDADLCRRLRDRGYTIRHVSAAHVAHVGGGSSRAASALALREFHRSAYTYYATHVARTPLGRGVAGALLGLRYAWKERLSVSMLLALIPFAFLVVLVWRCYVDVPYWDEWEIVPRLQKLHDGTFSFPDLWGQHNEHRPLFGIALVLTIVRATRWNTAAEVAANVVVGALIFGVFAGQVISRWPAGYRLPLWLLPSLSLLAFSPSQWENWLWGWQVTILLNVLAVVTGLALLSRLEGRWTRLVGALLCGIVATYSFAAGLVFWVSGTTAWWLNRGQRKPAQIVVWDIVAFLTIASYFYDYHENPGHPSLLSNFADLQAFSLYLLYFSKYMGAAVAIYDPGLAAMAGWAGLALFAYLALGTRDLPGRPIRTFTMLTGFHCIAAGLMTGLGRTGFGTDQALSSRYVTISAPLWLAILVLAALRLSRGVETNRAAAGPWPIVRAGLISAAVVAIAVSAAPSGQWGTELSNTRHGQLEPARRALITGENDVLLVRLYPSVAALRDRREVLIAWHLSVFRSARAQRDQSTENR